MMTPNPKYLVEASQILETIKEGEFVRAIHETGDPVILVKDIKGLENYANQSRYNSLDELLGIGKVQDVNSIIGVPFDLYGTTLRNHKLKIFNIKDKIAISSEYNPRDFWIF